MKTRAMGWTNGGFSKGFIANLDPSGKGIYLLLAAIVLLAALSGLSLYQSRSQPVTISQADLLQDYGIQVKLIALTNLGGTIDFRLLIADAEKANLLLGDPNVLPTLWVGSQRIEIKAPTTGHRHHHYIVDGNLYLLFFPNPGYVVRSGTPVNIEFGDVRLEAINVQ